MGRIFYRLKESRFFKIDKETKEITGNYYVSSNSEQILKILKIINSKIPHIETVVIDDKN